MAAALTAAAAGGPYCARPLEDTRTRSPSEVRHGTTETGEQWPEEIEARRLELDARRSQ